MKILHFEKIKSTQDYLKKLKRPKEDVAVIADRQLGGKGTKGRSFSSEKGGAYLSLLKLRPCLAKESYKIMQSSAVAVCRTLAAFGIDAKIKWPNDVFASGRKICGILIENVISGEEVAKSIIGIGININNPLPEELSPIAVSAEEILGAKLQVDEVIATLLYNMYQPYSDSDYMELSMVIGKEITVLKVGQEPFKAIATDVKDGDLIISSGERLSAAEISIK